MNSLLKFLGVFFVLIGISNGLVSELKLNDDTRSLFAIEDFGFVENGIFNLTISNFSHEGDGVCGFLVDFSSALSSSSITTATACPFLEGTQDISTIGFIIKPPFKETIKHVVKSGREGYHHTFFANCKQQKISFGMYLEQYNLDSEGKRNYLSIGEVPNIALNASFCGVYAVLVIAWLIVLRKNKEGRHRIHHLMTVLLILKILAFAFSAIQLSYQAIHGTRGGWAVPYFGFLMIKGTFLFIIVVLLGSGWSIVKPYLSNREKSLIAVVLSLQVIDNIALVYVEGATPGSADWASWHTILRVFDLICCCAIMFPVLWSIQHLKQASKTDGKAAVSLKKLSIFREFYLIVIIYVYFRVILLYLLSMSLTYKMTWASFISEEVVTLCLMIIVGYKFRPVKNNPYLKVDDDDNDDPLADVADRDNSEKEQSSSVSIPMSTTTTHINPRENKDEDKIEITPIP